jgi:DUF1680 family protein
MMKQNLIWKIILLMAISGFINSCGNKMKTDYPLKPVPFTEVSFSDQFWGPRLETNRAKTIPFAFKQCEETGRIANFEIAGGLKKGTFLTRYSFDDSDVYKIIEGASYSLARHPDPALDKYLDELIAKIAAAQEKDGYLFTARTASLGSPLEMAGKERWSNLQWSHELYNVGHLYEAAVAHFKATRKKTLLDVALKNADLIAREFGPKKLRRVPGHQEIEIGLTKLYRVTKNKKYLNLAKFFLDERGNAQGHKLYGEYAQDHIPVVKQTEAVGHAVRAAYMYAGMADVAALRGDRAYVEAIDRLWENVVGKKIYLTGGIGATGAWEGFGPDYELPNASAYAETCASIANALWNYRMFLLHGESKYIDVLERILYNGFLSGISLSGDRFFYANPLASFGQHERSPWFTCACCPGNVSRFVPSIPGFVYAFSDDNLYINLFVQGKASIKTRTSAIQVEQETEYPWKGEVRIRISPEKPSSFTLHLRIPGWAQNQPIPGDLYRYLETSSEKPALKVNGEIVPLNLEKGYALLTRTWEKDTTIELSLPMPVRRVLAHDAVKADRGRVAVERGPVVYCAEWPDNMGYVRNVVLEDSSRLSEEFKPELLKGVTIIEAEAAAYHYKGGRLISQKQKLTLIPYYAWAHRGKGEMEVWLARRKEVVKPLPEPSIAFTSKASASGGRGIEALNDQFEPESSNDHSTRYFHWWPKKGTLEWVQYDFKNINRVAEVSVYWFDDTGTGECRVPKSWRVLYKSGEKWLPVKNLDSYGVEKDKYNKVRFSPIRTQALRLEIQLPEKFSSGIQEWKVK